MFVTDGGAPQPNIDRISLIVFFKIVYFVPKSHGIFRRLKLSVTFVFAKFPFLDDFLSTTSSKEPHKI